MVITETVSNENKQNTGGTQPPTHFCLELTRRIRKAAISTPTV
jgi:hypothetical protein